MIFLACDGDLVGAFRPSGPGTPRNHHQRRHPCPAPVARPPSSVGARADLAARDHYRACFGRDPRGIWLPECALSRRETSCSGRPALVHPDTHGVLHARPHPRYAFFAPSHPRRNRRVRPRPDSARQVWSRHEGYPGDPRYRDFYRDIGFDLISTTLNLTSRPGARLHRHQIPPHHRPLGRQRGL